MFRFQENLIILETCPTWWPINSYRSCCVTWKPIRLSEEKPTSGRPSNIQFKEPTEMVLSSMSYGSYLHGTRSTAAFAQKKKHEAHLQLIHGTSSAVTKHLALLLSTIWYTSSFLPVTSSQKTRRDTPQLGKGERKRIQVNPPKNTEVLPYSPITHKVHSVLAYIQVATNKPC